MAPRFSLGESMTKRSSHLASLQRVVGFFALFGGSCITSAQTSQATAPPNDAVTQILTQALNAMGGSGAWSQVSDATVSGNCTSSSAGNTTAEPPSTFLWIVTANNQFRYQSGKTGQGNALLSGTGSPLFATPSETKPLTAETGILLKPYHLPGMAFLQILNDQNYTASVVGQETVLNTTTIHIHVMHRGIRAPEIGSDQDWWLDASTYLPVAVTYLVPGQTMQSYMPTSYYFSSWELETRGIAVPFSLLIETGAGFPSGICTINQVNINSQPVASLFTAG